MESTAAFTLISDLAARLRVMESVLLALIVTHPNREAAKTVFHGLASIEGNLVLDAAFAQAIPPNWAQRQVQEIEQVVPQWRDVFEKAHDPKQ